MGNNKKTKTRTPMKTFATLALLGFASAVKLTVTLNRNTFGSIVKSNRSLANLMISGIYSKRTAWELGHNHHIEFNLRTRLEHRLLSELHQLVSECPCFSPSFPSNRCILRESA